MVLSAVSPHSVTRAAATWRSGRPVLLMSRARSPLRCGPLRRKRSHRASSRQGRPSARWPDGTVGRSDASGHSRAIKVAVCFPDGMHDDGELACHRYGSPTQSDPYHHCAPPTSQRAVGSLIAAPFASEKCFLFGFKRRFSSRPVHEERAARRLGQDGPQAPAKRRGAVLTQSSTTRGCGEVGRHRCRIMVLSAVGLRIPGQSSR